MQPTDKRIATVEQWQALKGVIDGNIGKAKILTTGDYNYPVDNPTKIAVWLLSDGTYNAKGVNAWWSTASAMSDVAFVKATTSNGRPFAMEIRSTGVILHALLSDGSSDNSITLLSRNDVENRLTSTSTNTPLSAYQGKVLKDMIDAIVVPTKTSDLTNDSDFQTGTDVATAVSAVETKLNDNVMTELTMATDATKVEFTETKKNLSTGTTSTEVDTIPLASTTQAGILNAAGYQSIIDSQDRLDALAGGAVSIANLSANPSQSDLTTAWQTATGETTVFNRASIFDSTNGKNWTYFDNTSAWEVTGTVNQSITINNFSQGTAGLIVGDNTAGKVYAEQDGTGSVYGWDALNTRVTNVESATANIPSVVQTTGTSATDVMSQNAVTSMAFQDPSAKQNIQLGSNASSTGAGVAIGTSSRAYLEGDVGIGMLARADGRGSIALGARSHATQRGQFDVGTDLALFGYNNSNYRLLTGLYDPQSAHDAANKEYVDNLAVTYAALNGTAAPTTATAGTYVGQLYLDTTNDKMYYLSAIDTTTPEYTWAEIGGSSVNVVQTTGTSTTDVMSQNAVTSMMYADPSTTTKVQIGDNAQNLATSGGTVVGNNSSISSGNNGGTALGAGALVVGAGAIAIAGGWNGALANAAGAISIGGGANTTGRGAISIGYFTPANQEQGKIEVGSTATNYGYNNSNYRLLTGLYDGQNDHDAVTVGQLNTAIAGVSGAAEINSTDWSALWQ